MLTLELSRVPGLCQLHDIASMESSKSYQNSRDGVQPSMGRNATGSIWGGFQVDLNSAPNRFGVDSRWGRPAAEFVSICVDLGPVRADLGADLRRSCFDPVGVDFWVDQGPLKGRFGVASGRFGADVGSIRGRSWVAWGPIRGRPAAARSLCTCCTICALHPSHHLGPPKIPHIPATPCSALAVSPAQSGMAVEAGPISRRRRMARATFSPATHGARRAGATWRGKHASCIAQSTSRSCGHFTSMAEPCPRAPWRSRRGPATHGARARDCLSNDAWRAPRSRDLARQKCRLCCAVPLPDGWSLHAESQVFA